MTAAAEDEGGREIRVETTSDETEIVVSFAIVPVGEDEARRPAHHVLDAAPADEFSWQVGVLERFAS